MLYIRKTRGKHFWQAPIMNKVHIPPRLKSLNPVKMQVISTLILVSALLMAGLSACQLQAQSFSEWFKQKKTQKKYLLAQIAALETYALALEKGYHIAKDGLGSISQLKQRGYLQHQLHFKAMTEVIPAVKNNQRVSMIAAMEDRSAALRRRLMAGKDIRRWLTKEENGSLAAFDREASAEAAKDLAALELLITGKTLEMTAAERISQMEQLYKVVKQKYRAVLLYTKSTTTLIEIRKKRSAETSLLKGLYGK